jgi:cyclin G-associated kinase
MHRNSSAPSLDKKEKKFDPFADFLASSATSNDPERPAAAPNTPVRSSNNSGRSTPSNVQRFVTQTPQDRKNFESFFGTASTTGVGQKFGETAFDDLLSEQGFSSTAKNSQRSLASIRREEEVKVVDPITLKIRDWTAGKEGNIRALLSSLNEVLWEDANYTPPTVAEMLSDSSIKKCYMKAVIVIHPDKQAGQPHEELAKAIFAQLNLSWEKFKNEKA